MAQNAQTRADMRKGGPGAPWLALGLLLYLLVAAGLAIALGAESLSPGSATFFATLGAIGIWRYGWAAVHLVRAWIYLRVRFPALRAAASAVAGSPPNLFVLITAYRQDPALTTRMFRSVMAEASAFAAPVTVIAAVTDPAERALLDRLVRRLDLPSRIRFVIMEQDGSGKRSALAEGLRAIARRNPGPEALVVMMDGDTVLPPDTLRRVAPFFRLDRGLAAVTTDAEAIVSGTAWSWDWYRLRYAQRHLLMASLSMSRRLLVLTGRFSVFRANLATEPGFVAAVEADSLRHWRYGTVRFLTGDDKSTWYWLLRRGQPMLYLPDVRIMSLEEVPSGRFVAESVGRMRRWYGNMLRNNGRALALGPRRMPFFVWWCLADQRMSMWTSLSGPVFAVTAAAFGEVLLLPAYLLWVMLSRLVYAAGLSKVTGGFSVRWPLLLYYSQIAGSLVKVAIGFSLDRQEWSRQRVGARKTPLGRAFWNRYLAALAGGLFIYVSATASAGLQPPDRLLLAGPFASVASTPPRTEEIQADLDAGGLVFLPEGIIPVDRPLLIRRDDVRLIGAGVGKTVLLARFEGEDAAVVDVVGPSPSRLERGSCARSVTALAAGDTALALRGSLPDKGFVWMGAPNDGEFLQALGAMAWDKEFPWLRQALAAYSVSTASEIKLVRPLATALPAGTWLCAIGLLRGVEIRDVTVAFDLGGRPHANDYGNARPRHGIDGIRVNGAVAPLIRDVAVEGAGRHALHLDNVLAPQVHRFTAEGAWNKGPGGNGYVRLARTYDGRLIGLRVRGLRHLAIQWSSYGNVIEDLDSDTDVNFHGGYAHDNRVAARRLTMRSGHPWAAVTRTPPDARWAPPDGPGNTVTIKGERP